MAAAKRSVVKSKKPVPARRAPTPRGVDKKKAQPGAPARSRELDANRLEYVRELVRDIPDFPKPGILFRDITPILADPRGFHIVLNGIAERYLGEPIDAVVGIEARGFIFGGALAARLNASFVPVRKPGKLPARADTVAYSLEYGENELQMHADALREGARVLVVDDLLATGGTASAAGELVRRQGAYVIGFAFVLELEALGGRDALAPTPVTSLLRYP
ncbi:MAG: adenine phosphoribosyltransferase [Polyangiaceae bacterium]|nr:adenine phosphoribosyltransferase [Polyangiaceae bacterium]